MNRLAVLPTLLLVMTLAGLGVVFAFADGLVNFARTPLPLSAPVCFDIGRGTALSGVVRELQGEVGLSEAEATRLRWLARLSGTAARLRAGEYRVEPGQTPAGLVRMLAEGKVVLHRITFVPGMTLEQARDVLAHHPAVRQEGFALRPAALMAALGQPGKPAEGAFLPETYAFPRGRATSSFCAWHMRPCGASSMPCGRGAILNFRCTRPRRPSSSPPSSRKKPARPRSAR